MLLLLLLLLPFSFPLPDFPFDSLAPVSRRHHGSGRGAMTRFARQRPDSRPPLERRARVLSEFAQSWIERMLLLLLLLTLSLRLPLTLLENALLS